MYRIKHKETGLYYQPSTAGNNLGKTGKVYATHTSPLTMEPNRTYINIHIAKDSNVYKKYKELFDKYKHYEYSSMSRYIDIDIPKSDFEIENESEKYSMQYIKSIIDEHIKNHPDTREEVNNAYEIIYNILNNTDTKMDND